MQLNPGQEEAESHKEGPMMVLAGPGSGKTTVITYRVKYLIEKHSVSPSQILVVTFSKAAATNMAERYKKLNSAPGVTFATFHSLFFKIIRAHTEIGLDNILKDEEKAGVIKSILKNLGVEWDDESLSNISQELSYTKNTFTDIRAYKPKSIGREDFGALALQYEEYKAEHNKIDFDDMLTKCYNLLTDENILKIWQKKYKYIMIDEFQDINDIQYSIVKLLCVDKNIYIVGDDDQSIYRFRGSRPDFLLNFPKDFENTKTALLDINYRSTEEIIRFSNFIIKPNTARYAKTIRGTGKKGKAPILIRAEDINQEANYIADKIKTLDLPLDEICIIYRANIQSRALIDALSNQNIPFKVKDEIPGVYQHFIAKDLAAYMSLSLDINNNKAAAQIINKPKRFINKGIITTLSKKPSLVKALISTKHLKQWQKLPVETLAYDLKILKKLNPFKGIKYIRKNIGYENYIKEYADFRQISSKGLFEILDELTESSKAFQKLEDYLYHTENFAETQKASDFGVQLSTMHGVKGLEFSAVFIISCVEGVIPHERSTSPESIEEERRLFYVAVTRAKELLYLSVINNRYEEEVEPTGFLKGLI